MKSITLIICIFIIFVYGCKSKNKFNSDEKVADELANNVNAQNEIVFSEWDYLTTLYNNRNEKGIELVGIVNMTLGSNTFDSKKLNELLNKSKEIKNINDIILEENKFVSFSDLQKDIANQISSLLIIAENKHINNESYTNNLAQLERFENQIAIKRQQYNNVVKTYNKKIENANNTFFKKYPNLGKKNYFKP